VAEEAEEAEEAAGAGESGLFASRSILRVHAVLDALLVGASEEVET